MRSAAHAKSLTLHFGMGQIRENVRHASLEFQCLETPEGKAVRRPGPEVFIGKVLHDALHDVKPGTASYAVSKHSTHSMRGQCHDARLFC